jgi:hypothetical protein
MWVDPCFKAVTVANQTRGPARKEDKRPLPVFELRNYKKPAQNSETSVRKFIILYIFRKPLIVLRSQFLRNCYQSKPQSVICWRTGAHGTRLNMLHARLAGLHFYLQRRDTMEGASSSAAAMGRLGPADSDRAAAWGETNAGGEYFWDTDWAAHPAVQPPATRTPPATAPTGPPVPPPPSLHLGGGVGGGVGSSSCSSGSSGGGPEGIVLFQAAGSNLNSMLGAAAGGSINSSSVGCGIVLFQAAGSGAGLGGAAHGAGGSLRASGAGGWSAGATCVPGRGQGGDMSVSPKA